MLLEPSSVASHIKSRPGIEKGEKLLSSVPMTIRSGFGSNGWAEETGEGIGE